MYDRRSRNFKNPSEEQVLASVGKVIDCARRAAKADHNNSLVSDKELSHITETYLARAFQRNRDDRDRYDIP